MPTLAPPSWPALVPVLATIVAVWLPRPGVSAVALLCTAAALGLHLPALGMPAMALSIAAALPALAMLQPRVAARSLHLGSLPWLVAAAAVDHPAPELPIVAHGAAALACLGLIAATTCAVVWADTPRRRLTLALVTLALPLAPSGGSLVRWHTAIVLPHEGVAASWLAQGTYPTALEQGPRWLAALPGVTWTLALLGLAVAWARLVRPQHDQRLPAPWSVLALAGLLGLVVAIAGLSVPSLHVPGLPLAMPRPADATLDLTLLLIWWARLLSAWGLLRMQTPLQPVPRTGPIAQGLVLGAALLLAILWLATAPGWLGDTWLADPAAYAVAALLVATAAALPSLWLGPDPARDVAQVLQLLAALWLVGGAEAGWRLAGALLPS